MVKNCIFKLHEFNAKIVRSLIAKNFSNVNVLYDEMISSLQMILKYFADKLAEIISFKEEIDL
jgi:hypothetical protein